MTDVTTRRRRRIVAGIDHSENSKRAAAWAAREAADRRLPLHLVHALELPASAGLAARAGYVEECRHAAQARLAEVGDELAAEFPTLTISTETSEAAEAGAVATLVAQSRDAELVVVGTRGHGGFAGLLLGAVSLGLAAHAACATVVVPVAHPDTPRNEIVLGVGPEEPEASIGFAFASAAALGAELHAVRAWTPFLLRGRDEDPAELNLRDEAEATEVAGLLAGARERHTDVSFTVSVTRGNAVPELIAAARGSRLLVVGARRRRSPLSVGVGYVVQGLLSHAATAVAVVPDLPAGRYT